MTNSGRNLILFGRLATEGELYAKSIPSIEIEDGAEEIKITAKSQSSKPTKLAFEESTDLSSWRSIVGHPVSTTRNSATVEVEKSEKSPKKFIRARAKKIPADNNG